MILVMLGTQNNSFVRLLQEIENLIKKNVITEEVVVQAGYTKYETDKMKILNLIPKDELEKLIKDSSFVITHGGVGSITMSLELGKKVIAVPRKHKYNEHVNDHQEEIVNLFNQKKYLIGINDVNKLEDAIKNIETFEPEKFVSNNGKIITLIENYIDSI